MTTSASRVPGPRPLRGSLSAIGVPGNPRSTTPPGIMVTATGEGTVSHLVSTSLVQTVCVNVVDFTPLGPSYLSLTAPDGDRVDGIVTGVVFRPDGFDMDVAITGGTGRFAQAGGVYSVNVMQAAPLQPFTATLAGWIEY